MVGSKKVPANFFAQPEVRNVSAILFSNPGTMAKFNRMGVLAGFGDPEVSLVRSGGYGDLTPGALKPTLFEINIEDLEYREEGWADEIEIYHNPNAIVPLPKQLFPNVKIFLWTRLAKSFGARPLLHPMCFSPTRCCVPRRRSEGRAVKGPPGRAKCRNGLSEQRRKQRG